MNDINDFLVPGSVVAGLHAVSKKALFQQLAKLAETAHGIAAPLVIERLTERERLGSTGFGGGIAIPHGKIEGLDRIVAVFVQLAEPIDFAAIDDLPVDLVFMLLSPVDAGADHLKALAQVSRALRDKVLVAKLRGAANDDALHALVVGGETRDAA
jgi:nitrogen PTS system EIIA component